ncbi:hypothetical protein OS493_012443 [Desmophyllum pertusum]|uniref:Uncharacterized protein n=1 Tax=Desmophyllum pertusum TaxID=174260 RepID=A0A9X0D414_9CNID|nr:hypothetical protein OS493_012443 [Desmophyllum pertusum]
MRRKIAPQRSDHDEMLAGLDDLVHLIEAAAKRLKNHTLCLISQQAFAYLSHIYTSMFDEKPTIRILNGEVIADTMKDLVDDVTANMDFLLKIEKAQKRRQKGEDSETSEDEDPGFELQHRRAPKLIRAVPSNSEPEHSAAASKPALRASSSKRSDSESPVTPSKTASPHATSKRSHHKKKKCPILKCSFYGNDLRRHLQTHVRKKLADDGLNRLVSIVTTGKRQRGKAEKQGASKKPKPGRFKKW